MPKEKDPKVIVSKKEVEEDLKKKPIKKKDPKEDEPSWYHYLIVLGAFFTVFAVIYFAFEIFDTQDANPQVLTQTYPYEHKVGNVTYSINFHYPLEELLVTSYPIEVNEQDFFNSITMRIGFLEYNGTDNGRVTIASSKMVSLLKGVYHFQFPVERFVRFNETMSCLNSTSSDKILVYNPYSNRNGVFIDENSCITVEATNADELVKVNDKFIFNLIAK